MYMYIVHVAAYDYNHYSNFYIIPCVTIAMLLTTSSLNNEGVLVVICVCSLSNSHCTCTQVVVGTKWDFYPNRLLTFAQTGRKFNYWFSDLQILDAFNFLVTRPTCWCPTTYSGQFGKSTFAVTMGRHTKLPIQGSHILKMLSVL